MIRQNGRQEQLTFLSSQMSKLIKQKYGKGPDSCVITMEKGMMLAHVRHFKTPAEEVLIQRNEVTLAYKYRSVILEAIFEQFKHEIKKAVNLDINSFVHEWDYETNTGIILFYNNQLPLIKLNVMENGMKEYVMVKMKEIYTNICKAPSEMKFYKYNENVYIIECKNVMLPIERHLYNKGHCDLLRSYSIEASKNFDSLKGKLHEEFPIFINEVYTIWDYSINKKYIFLLKE
ncbi:Na-translocating system protein MpsC family protein [Evansella cellulosilytica]|uniref:Na+-translocating membrane potential-generating system MpsC domain-containing protein n=1 Tax=Evansella cellulosilytica (strain ATCC 21833 / DSM 2522 / FERM P-1141 / JCM 9156 / N-4) TaxID=649639 RepID=E6TYA4_EVAC2|nr:Na-translocating system protein MpsC family protein [Evansella cellulosilytica]ADU32423.1 hypothetical protein Bcell_4196 [Evansella cellulosilytica DSM 2522]